MKKEFKILSWGGGSQSSAIIQLYLDNKINLDYIIFSDTGMEPGYVYKQINEWLEIPKVKKITHIARSNEDLNGMLKNYLNGTKKALRQIIYSYNPITNHYGKNPKTCTGSYKIIPAQSLINKLIRKELGLSIRKSLKKLNIHITQYIGYSSDEIHRAKKMKNTNFYSYEFPLIERKMNFIDTINYLKKNKKGIKRSACFHCPFRNDDVNGMGWIDIYREDRQNWIRLLELDINIRNKNQAKNNYYLDSSCIPLWITYKNLHNNFKKYKELDKKGWSDYNLPNRKWKKKKVEICNSPKIGSCSL